LKRSVVAKAAMWLTNELPPVLTTYNSNKQDPGTHRGCGNRNYNIWHTGRYKANQH